MWWTPLVRLNNEGKSREQVKYEDGSMVAMIWIVANMGAVKAIDP